MSITHLISIIIGFPIAYTAGVLNHSLNMYPFSVLIDEPLTFPTTKSLSKILKFCWIFNRTFTIL